MSGTQDTALLVADSVTAELGGREILHGLDLTLNCG